MDTFRNKIDEDFAGALAKMGKGIVNVATRATSQQMMKLRARFGDAAAEGKLDLQDATAALMNEWKYYAAHQKLETSIGGIVDFLSTVVGIPITKEQAFLAIFNQDADATIPDGDSKNSDWIKRAFTALVDPRADDEFVTNVANHIARVAEESGGDDRTLIIKWMNILSIRNPELVKKNSMRSLLPYTHGGVLTKQQLMVVMQGVAKILLKSEYAAVEKEKRDTKQPSAAQIQPAGQQPNAEQQNSVQTNEKPETIESDGNPIQLPEQREVPKPLGEISYETREYVRELGLETEFKETNWASPHFLSKRPWQLNKITAYMIAALVRLNCTKEEFRKVGDQTGVPWPSLNSVAMYDYVRIDGGNNFLPVIQDLNHYFDTPMRCLKLMSGVYELTMTKNNKNRKKV